MRIARLPIVLVAACASGEALADETPPAAGPLRFTLSWTEAEHSRDSNSQAERFTVEGDHLSWSWDYGGFHPSPSFKRHRAAKAKVGHPEKLRQLLAAGGLAKDEKIALHSNEKTRDVRTVEAVLEVTRAGKTTRAEVSGPIPRGEGAPALYTALAQLRVELLGLLPDDR